MNQILENGIMKPIEHPTLKIKVMQSLELKRVLKLTLFGI